MMVNELNAYPKDLGLLEATMFPIAVKKLLVSVITFYKKIMFAWARNGHKMTR